MVTYFTGKIKGNFILFVNFCNIYEKNYVNVVASLFRIDCHAVARDDG